MRKMYHILANCALFMTFTFILSFGFAGISTNYVPVVSCTNLTVTDHTWDDQPQTWNFMNNTISQIIYIILVYLARPNLARIFVHILDFFEIKNYEISLGVVAIQIVVFSFFLVGARHQEFARMGLTPVVEIILHVIMMSSFLFLAAKIPRVAHRQREHETHVKFLVDNDYYIRPTICTKFEVDRMEFLPKQGLYDFIAYSFDVDKDKLEDGSLILVEDWTTGTFDVVDVQSFKDGLISTKVLEKSIIVSTIRDYVIEPPTGVWRVGVECDGRRYLVYFASYEHVERFKRTERADGSRLIRQSNYVVSSHKIDEDIVRKIPLWVSS